MPIGRLLISGNDLSGIPHAATKMDAALLPRLEDQRRHAAIAQSTRTLRVTKMHRTERDRYLGRSRALDSLNDRYARERTS